MTFAWAEKKAYNFPLKENIVFHAHLNLVTGPTIQVTGEGLGFWDGHPIRSGFGGVIYNTGNSGAAEIVKLAARLVVPDAVAIKTNHVGFLSYGIALGAAIPRNAAAKCLLPKAETCLVLADRHQNRMPR